MKKVRFLFPVLIMVIFVSSLVMADTNDAQKKEAEKVRVENLLMGLDSDNNGLMISSAYYLGELKASKATIPLMKMLHEGNTEEQRIAAALSLYKIGSDKSIYAVKGASKFDESKRVRKFCKKLYNVYVYDQIQISKDVFKGYAVN
jgi:HEAT repeat protein